MGRWLVVMVAAWGCACSASVTGRADPRDDGDDASDQDIVVTGDTDTGDDDADAAGDDAGDAGDAAATIWSAPVSLVEDLGRLAIGNAVHVVGHVGANLVHRRSADDGVTWTAATTIAAASSNYPAMYGGFYAVGDTLYLLTAPDDMDSSAPSGGRQLDFRKSVDNGDSWTAPVRITTDATPIFRVRIVASGEVVHVVGTSEPTTGASLLYFRSIDGGAQWATTTLAADLGIYGGGQTVAVEGSVVHVAYTLAQNGVGAGPTYYRRSVDAGVTWSAPAIIGETSPESSRQARVQLSVADGHVFAVWQREANMTGATVPADRIGYNTSSDAGATWGAARVLPFDTGVDRNHQHVWMASGGGVHIVWRHGDSGDSIDDPAGAISSVDYGATWGTRLLAVDTRGELTGANHTWSVVADEDAVHVLTGPDGLMQYARRRLR